MSKYLVTVKLPNNPDHDPKNKQTSLCPVSKKVCTDVTGAHHTLLWESGSIQEILDQFELEGMHVTRIEGI